ncbi:MAG: hypothetical protein ACREQX_10425 [Candidatus Binataceae bacterium]
MRHAHARMVLDGAVAGLIGALVIALWFLVFDAARGLPLETPALLAAALLHGASPTVLNHAAWTLVAEYTVVHFAVFAGIGIVGALLMAAAERNKELFGALFVFVVAFEIFFIAVVMLAGPAARASLPWWKVIIGNLMATAAMLAYFFWRQPRLAQNLLGPWTDVVVEGIISGILGGVIIAVWFLIVDAAAGQPFHTPAMLGAVIFQAVGIPETGTVTVALVLGYTAVHFFAFILFGIAASVTMAASEHEPLLALGVLVLFVWFELCFVGFVTFLDQTAVTQLGWWKLIVGNVAALAAIIAYYEHGHPRIVPRIAERWNRLESEGRRPPRPVRRTIRRVV